MFYGVIEITILELSVWVYFYECEILSWCSLFWLDYISCASHTLSTMYSRCCIYSWTRCFLFLSNSEQAHRGGRVCVCFDHSEIFNRARWRFIMHIGNDNNEFNQHLTDQIKREVGVRLASQPYSFITRLMILKTDASDILKSWTKI